MNDAARLIAELPDETPVSVTVGQGSMTAKDLRRAFIATQAKRILTTGDASDLFGYSASMWAKWAAAGRIEGAYQDAEGGPWRLPYESCDAHVERRREEGSTRGERRGRPWGSTEGVSGRRLEVVSGGPETVGRTPDGDSGSERERVARRGQADRFQGAR